MNDPIYVKYPEKVNPESQKEDERLPGVAERANGEWLLNDHEFSLGIMEMFCLALDIGDGYTALGIYAKLYTSNRLIL